MNIRNKVSLNYISALTAPAILFILTVQSRDTESFYFSFHTYLTSQQDTAIPTNKKNITVDKKLALSKDSSGVKIVSNTDSIPKKNIDSLAKADTIPQKNADSLSKTDTSGFLKTKYT